jgi:two-component system phosphate regulon response regulator OmpR
MTWLASSLAPLSPALPGRYDPRSQSFAAGAFPVSQVQVAAGTSPLVMVVDDEPELRSLLGEYFARHGFEVVLAEDAAAARRQVAQRVPELAILDVNMPGENGLSLARFLRETHPRLGLVMLTTAGESVDRIVGLELGADDYLTKPFNLRELLARARAVLRRAEVDRAAPPADSKGTKYRFAGWELNMRLRRLTSPAGTSVDLTSGEFSLLTAFVRSPQQVLSREQLLAATRVHDDVYDRSVDVQILRLRRKLEIDPNVPKLIRTERGAGYIFSVPVEVA